MLKSAGVPRFLVDEDGLTQRYYLRPQVMELIGVCILVILVIGMASVFAYLVAMVCLGLYRCVTGTPASRAVGFPVIALEDGEGLYLISGVMRETEEDTQLTIFAKSRANAIAKAEIRGMVVTKIEKLIKRDSAPQDERSSDPEHAAGRSDFASRH